MTETNIEDFSEKAKEFISSLTESFGLENLTALKDSELDDVFGAENNISIDSPVEYEIIDDEPVETFAVDGDIEEPSEETLGYIAPVDDGSTLSDGETIQTTTNTMSVPFESAPKFRIYWRAWKEGNSTSGQTESNLDTAQMARAEAMTKLYDLGFTDLEILAIETIKNEEQPESQI